MAKTGKKQTKERGLNVRVTQEQKNSIPGNVRVNSYQKKNKKRLSNEEIAQKIEATKKVETTKKARKNSKKTSQPTEATKDAAKLAKEIPKVVEETVETAKKAPEAAEETVEVAEKASEIAEKTIETIEKVSEEAAEETVRAAEKAPKTAEKTSEIPKEPVDFSSNAKFEEATKPSEQNPLNVEFETMKLGEVEKPESKIVLRDVEKEKHTDVPKKNTAKKEETEAKKEELPKAVKTVIYNPVPMPKLSAKEIKEREIEKAVKTASKPDTHKRKTRRRLEFGWQRVVLAVFCAATAVFAIAYFVNLTSTDMSLKVAAMQSGIEASYPSYIPRGYTLTDVTSATGKVIMHFKNGDDEFGITEESSNWDSEALLNEYIKENYGNEYTLVREQGLTLYMGGNWEAWVSGGVLYKLSVTSGSLTKKQMKSIAVSM